MRLELLCPACGLRDFESEDYESMILLAQNLALVQFACPGCGMNLSVTMRLTQALYREAAKRLSEQASSPVSTAPAEPEAPDAPRPAATTPDALTPAPAPAPSTTISYASHLVVDEEPEGFHLISPLCVGNPETKGQLEYFRRQLDKVETVDDAIQEIGQGYHRERRDG